MNDKRYVSEAFKDNELVLVLPFNHPLNEKDEIRTEDILSYNFLISNEQSATRKFILSQFNEHHITLTNLTNLYNTNTIKESVINGLGISILSKNAILNEEKLGLLTSKKLVDLPLVRKLYIVRKTSHTLLEEEALFMKQFLK